MSHLIDEGEKTMSEMSTIGIAKLPGVADLVIGARLMFARALAAEQRGDLEEAAEYLERAIDLESKPRENDK